MSFVATAIGGAAVVGLVGASMQANAAKDAANTQAAAANNANQTQWNMFEQQQANQQPWLQGGANALQQLEWEMGMNPTGFAQPSSSQPGSGTSLFDIGRTPNTQSAFSSSPTMQSYTPTGEQGSLNRQFTMADFQQDPGYQFQLQQGLDAINRSAAAKGFLNSTGTMQNLNNYAQGMAEQSYNTSYNRFKQNQTDTYNRLANLAGVGQTAANNVGTMGMNTATNIGANQMAAGAAQSAGQIASGNAWGGALNGVSNGAMNYAMMNKMFGNNTPTTGFDANQGGGAFNMPSFGSPSTYSYGGQTMGDLMPGGGGYGLGVNTTLPEF